MVLPQLLERIAGLDRVLSTPGSSVVMVGPCGAGRRTTLQVMRAIGMEVCAAALWPSIDIGCWATPVL